VGVTTSPPPATNGGQLVVRNGSGVAGRPDSGDQIVVTYVDSPSAGDFCDGWSGTSTLTGPTVVVTGTEAQSGDDEIEASDSECLGGFNFGTIDLGQNGYFRGSVTFGGLSLGCSIVPIDDSDCTQIALSGDTLTMTLGAPSATQETNPSPSVAIYSPSSALDQSGTFESPDEIQF